MLFWDTELQNAGLLAMTEQEMSRICRLVQKGAKLLVGRTPSGMRKIKLVRGPFGMMTERYELTNQELDTLMQRLQHQPSASH
jgi:hypothetical protein